MSVKFSNNAATTLSADISAGATSFTVASASTFPTLASGDWTYVSLTSEVVKIDTISGNTFELFENDTVQSPHTSGESVELRMTAELLNDFAEDTEALPLAGGTMTGAIITNSVITNEYGSQPWSHGEATHRPLSIKTYSEAGSIGTTGTSAYTDVYGEADLTAIDLGETFTYTAAWQAVETHGARLPTLAELWDGVGSGSGQSYDDKLLWTCTPAGPHHVYVALGTLGSSSKVFGTDYKIVDINDALEVYRTRGFFDVSRNGRDVRYSHDGDLDVANINAVGNIAVTGTVDGRDVADDGAKLDLIDAGAVMESDTTTASMSFVVDEDAMTSNSATKLPTQQSVKAYVDSEVAAAIAGEMTLKGDYNASTNTPDLDTTPIATAVGDMYIVTVAGTFFSTAVEAGDMLIAKQATATLITHWSIVNRNIDSTAFATAAQGTTADNALPKTGGTVSGTVILTGGDVYAATPNPALRLDNGSLWIAHDDSTILFDEGQKSITSNDAAGNFSMQGGIDDAQKIVSGASYVGAGISKLYFANVDSSGTGGYLSLNTGDYQLDGAAAIFNMSLTVGNSKVYVGNPNNAEGGSVTVEIASTTGLNASAISYGTISDARLPASISSTALEVNGIASIDAIQSTAASTNITIKPGATGSQRGYVEIYPDDGNWYDQGGGIIFKGGKDSGASGTAYHPDAKIYLGDTSAGSASDGEDLVLVTGGTGPGSGSITLRTNGEDVSINNGSVTATSFSGDGSALTGIDAATVSTTAPTSPAAGDMWFDTTAGTTAMKVWSGSAWDQMSNKFSATGGTESSYSSGGITYKVHTFTSSGVFTAEAAGSIDVLIVAGGGGTYGGQGGAGGTGGGGAGGFVYNQGVSVIATGYTVTVGSGGSSYANGANSSFSSLTTAIGGGASGQSSSTEPKSGGSGGGAGFGSNVPYTPVGTGVTNQGFAGGLGSTAGSGTGGGGGGAKEKGTTDGTGYGGDGYTEGVDTVYNHNGGGNVVFGINGTGSAYAGGGGAGSIVTNSIPGGLGGGGIGSNRATAHHGTSNTGGGGGGGAYQPGPNSNGGSGIVIVRYAV